MAKTNNSPLIVDGEIILYGYVGGSPNDDWLPGFSGKHVIDALSEIEGDLTVRVNSGGGSAFDGIAIYNLLMAHDGDVTIRVDAVAASAASVIAMAGDEIIIPGASVLMIHNASLITWGDTRDHLASAEFLAKLDGQMADLYAQKTGISVDDLAKMMDQETWLTGDEAVEMGFAHSTGVAANDDEADGEDEDAAAAQFPYEIFMHAPDRFAAVASLVPEASRTHLQGLGLRLPGASREPANKRRLNSSAALTASSKKDNHMPKAIEKKAAGDDNEVVDTKAVVAEATKTERKRASDIRSAVSAAKLDDKFADDLIEAGTSIDGARAQIIDQLADRDDDVETRSHVRVEVGADSRERFNTGVEHALLARIGNADGERNEFSSYTLIELARASLDHRNIRFNGGDRLQMAAMALNPQAFGHHTTDDFTLILANVARKSMLRGWDETPETFERWTARGTLTDFKVVKRVDLNLFPNLAEVPEGAEYSHATVGERGEQIQLATYGRKFSITRQAIINDDLSMFDRIPLKMGRAARRTIGNLVYAVVTNNGNMSDGVPLFHADHGNLATTGKAVPGVSNVSAAKVAMGTQKDPDAIATALNIRPSYMLVPMALEDGARVLATSENDPSKTQRVPNPHRGSFEVISDARLDADSATAWYMAGDPNQVDTIEVSYLDGQSAPVLEERAGWDVDGVDMKIRMDAGVSPLDHRGLYKNPGA